MPDLVLLGAAIAPEVMAIADAIKDELEGSRPMGKFTIEVCSSGSSNTSLYRMSIFPREDGKLRSYPWDQRWVE